MSFKGSIFREINFVLKLVIKYKKEDISSLFILEVVID